MRGEGEDGIIRKLMLSGSKDGRAVVCINQILSHDDDDDDDDVDNQMKCVG